MIDLNISTLNNLEIKTNVSRGSQFNDGNYSPQNILTANLSPNNRNSSSINLASHDNLESEKNDYDIDILEAILQDDPNENSSRENRL